jgi:transcriptional regulator with XRE-family HTH domain
MKYQTPLKLTLAERILKLRNERGYSQEDLANLAGINRIYPGMIERCETNVSLVMLQRIAKVLDVPMERLLGADMEDDKKYINCNIRRILARQVRGHREAAKLSQDKLAKLVGVKWSYIASVERGSNIPVTKLEIIAGGLGVPAYALVVPLRAES